LQGFKGETSGAAEAKTIREAAADSAGTSSDGDGDAKPQDQPDDAAPKEADATAGSDSVKEAQQQAEGKQQQQQEAEGTEQQQQQQQAEGTEQQQQQAEDTQQQQSQQQVPGVDASSAVPQDSGERAGGREQQAGSALASTPPGNASVSDVVGFEAGWYAPGAEAAPFVLTGFAGEVPHWAAAPGLTPELAAVPPGEVYVKTATAHYLEKEYDGDDIECPYRGHRLPCHFGTALDAATADALWFHAPHMSGSPKELPPRVHPGQTYVVFSMEGAGYYPQVDNPDFMASFDLTMTYHPGSDVPVIYPPFDIRRGPRTGGLAPGWLRSRRGLLLRRCMKARLRGGWPAGGWGCDVAARRACLPALLPPPVHTPKLTSCSAAAAACSCARRSRAKPGPPFPITLSKPPPPFPFGLQALQRERAAWVG
jgi:hypothetical protein